jgi:hypothetical protein
MNIIDDIIENYTKEIQNGICLFCNNSNFRKHNQNSYSYDCLDFENIKIEFLYFNKYNFLIYGNKFTIGINRNELNFYLYLGENDYKIFAHKHDREFEKFIDFKDYCLESINKYKENLIFI